MYKCVYWLELFLRWAMWQMDLLLGHVVKFKLLVFIPCVLTRYMYLATSLLDGLEFLLICRLGGQDEGQTDSLHSKCLNILWALCLILTKLDTYVASRNYIPFDFQIKWLKVSQNCWFWTWVLTLYMYFILKPFAW